MEGWFSGLGVMRMVGIFLEEKKMGDIVGCGGGVCVVRIWRN